MYKDLRKIFSYDEATAEEVYDKRFNSEFSHHLDLKISGHDAFYIETPGITKMLSDIAKLDKAVYKYTNSLPDIAIEHLLKQFLIDEIKATNDIEGVYSSRKEINKVLESLETKKKDTKFLGLIKTYYYLTKRCDFNFKTCEDIRAAYDDILFDDVVSENPKNKPDGKLFRKDPVSVSEKGKDIHQGIFPEENIIKYLNKALKYLNNKDEDTLLRTAVFHYLFGYIHPFYDGNGRLSRYISSCMLASEYEPIIGYCLSMNIKENLAEYYKAFKICNHVLNRGDITPFVDYFVRVVYETFKRLVDDLKEKNALYNIYLGKLSKLKYSNDEKIFEVYVYLLQATLFSEIGISTKDLLRCANVTRVTLRSRLEKILETGTVKINKLGNEKYYLFKSLSVLNEE